MLYFALVRSKPEYYSVAWNSVTITDSIKFEGIQTKFADLCHNKLFQDVQYHHYNLLERLNLLTLHYRHCNIDVLFLINASSSIKFCSFVLGTVGIPLPARIIRNFHMLLCLLATALVFQQQIQFVNLQ
jgi:hypothetical protein